jgi:uncharacterized protein (TIGR02118 family)
MLRMTVLYPNGDDATFDWSYYSDQHLGLLAERYGPHFAKEPEVARGVAGLPKGEAPYLASAVMYFADQEALDAAMRAGGRDVIDDITNFTNTRAVMQVDEVV